MENKIDPEKIESLLIIPSSSKLLLLALVEISPRHVGFIRIFLITLISIILSLILIISSNTRVSFVSAVGLCNTTIIGIFGATFMGYALFQALISDNLLIRLINEKIEESKKDRKSSNHMAATNQYFARVMMLDIASIMLNIILITAFNDNVITLSINPFANNALTTFGIFIYFSFTFSVIWEMKSFVFNLYQLFNFHAIEKAIELFNRQEVDSSL